MYMCSILSISVTCSTKFTLLWLFQFQQLYDFSNTLYIRKSSALQNVSSSVVQTLHFLEHSDFSRSVKLNLCLRKPSLVHNSYWYLKNYVSVAVWSQQHFVQQEVICDTTSVLPSTFRFHFCEISICV